MSNKFSISDLYKDADGAISEPHLVQVLYKSGVPIAIDLPSFAAEAMKQMQDALIRAALEAGAEKLGDMLYLLSIGSPGDGPFTLQDRTRDEVIDQGVEAIRALKTNPDALAAIKAKAAEGRG